MMIEKYLEDLESRINPAEEERLRAEWRTFIDNGVSGPFFRPVRNPAPPSRLEWPKINVNDAILDPSFETMFLGQLCGVNGAISGNGGGLPMIRANYGSTILPTILGCQLQLMERDLNTLPGALPLPGGSDAVRKLLDAGIPDLRSGQGAQVFDCAGFFVKTLERYPKLKKHCPLYHPDFQGPLDICEVIYGSEIFLAFYDEPDLMRSFLTFVTDSYIAAMDKYFSLAKPADDYNFHYGWMHKGKIRISLDSCVNFSAEMYEDFILPHDKRLFNLYGGVIHSCGKVDHFTDSLNLIGAGYNGFNLSQPHLNDMEKIFSATVDKGVRIFGLGSEAVQKAVSDGRNLRGLVHSG